MFNAVTIRLKITSSFQVYSTKVITNQFAIPLIHDTHPLCMQTTINKTDTGRFRSILEQLLRFILTFSLSIQVIGFSMSHRMEQHELRQCSFDILREKDISGGRRTAISS